MEGGTGAAPLEFADHLGMPMREGLVFVRNALIGVNARDRIRIGCSGKIVNAFDMVRAMALGADWCNSARGFMFALGCIQSLSCHTDRCPTGVSTQDPSRARALVVEDKTERVRSFHHSMLHALAELIAAAGLEHPHDLKPEHISRRVNVHESMTFAELYPALKRGELIIGAHDPHWQEMWDMARADSFAPAEPGAAVTRRTETAQKAL
jgi:glutamate synthase domain-containing protein 2